MRVNSTVLGLVLAAFAAPALAGGSGNDLLMSGFGNDVIERPNSLPAVLRAAPSADTQRGTFEITFTGQVGTVTPNDAPNGLAATKPIAGPATHAMKGVVPNSTEVARYNLTHAWPKARTERPLASPQAEPPTQGSGTYSKTLTFTLSTTTPLDPAVRLATPSADASQAQGGGMGAGKANFGDFNLATLPGSAPRTAPPVVSSGRLVETPSVNYSKMTFENGRLGAAPGVGAIRR